MSARARCRDKIKSPVEYRLHLQTASLDVRHIGHPNSFRVKISTDDEKALQLARGKSLPREDENRHTIGHLLRQYSTNWMINGDACRRRGTSPSCRKEGFFHAIGINCQAFSRALGVIILVESAVRIHAAASKTSRYFLSSRYLHAASDSRMKAGTTKYPSLLCAEQRRTFGPGNFRNAAF